VTAANLGLLATDDIDGLDVFTNPTGTGACCHAGGTCAQVPQANCTAAGDVFWGPKPCAPRPNARARGMLPG
jgi:hypothetical protein